MSLDKANDVDFFPEPAPVVPNTVKSGTTDKVTSWRHHLKPAYVVSAAIVLALVWAVRPLMFKDAPSGASSIAQNSAARKYFAEPSGGHDDSVADKVEPAAEAAALAATTVKFAELQHQVNDLQAQLAAAQASPPTCVAATPPALITTTASASQRSPTRVRLHHSVKPGPVLSHYRINTLYPGQAWIEHEQRSWVVEPGSRINDLRVLRIDVATRTVVTTQGDIR
jgi:uncharacterized protein involved in copper resistance